MAGRAADPAAPRAIKGRGAVSSPTGRFEKIEAVQLAETGQHDFPDECEHSAPQTVIRSDRAKSILNRKQLAGHPQRAVRQPLSRLRARLRLLLCAPQPRLSGPVAGAGL